MENQVSFENPGNGNSMIPKTKLFENALNNSAFRSRTNIRYLIMRMLLLDLADLFRSYGSVDPRLLL